MLGDEDVLGDQAVASASLHSGDEPGVLQRHLARRDEDQALVDGLAPLVGERDTQDRPGGVPGTGVVVPAAGDPPAAVDLPGAGGGSQDAGDPGVGVRTEHLVLRLLGEQAGQPGADIGQGDHPGSGPVALGHGRRGVEHGPHPRLVAAVALGHRDFEQVGFDKCVDHLLGDTAVGLCARGVLAQQRLKSHRAGDCLLTVLSSNSSRGISYGHWFLLIEGFHWAQAWMWSVIGLRGLRSKPEWVPKVRWL